MTEPAELARLALEAGDAGIATMIHAIGDHAVRVALRALEPVAGRTALMPRVEHVQLCAAADARRFAPAGIAASVQPIHLRTDADQARRLWGVRAERRAYAWAALAATGADVAFGTDAPVEPIDPWPGIALAVTRRSPDWGPGAGAFGPDQAMTLARALRSACVDPAVSAGESDRGRLVAGRRADVVVIPAAALVEPVEAGGALETVRPRLVLVDGEVAAER
jgi:predicted amidohydrolase YtcJ